ncbi:hypothetical protein D3C75_1328330 [compost metagenome]
MSGLDSLLQHCRRDISGQPCAEAVLADLNRIRSGFGIKPDILQGAGGCKQFRTFHL